MMKIDRDEFERMRAPARTQLQAMADAPGKGGVQARSFLAITFDEFVFEEIDRGTPATWILAAIIDRCCMAMATQMKSQQLNDTQVATIAASIPGRVLQFKGAIDGLSAEALASCSVAGKPVN